jgi:hypothetical protein
MTTMRGNKRALKNAAGSINRMGARGRRRDTNGLGVVSTKKHDKGYITAGE